MYSWAYEAQQQQALPYGSSQKTIAAVKIGRSSILIFQRSKLEYKTQGMRGAIEHKDKTKTNGMRYD